MAYTTIDKPSDYFETKLYTGTGSEQSITGLDFAPNWVWVKCRSDAENHVLHDTVRGATKVLHSDTTDGEYTVAQGLKSFNSDGFTLGTSNFMNQSSRTFASWNWKKTADAGFDIVSYSGNNSTNRQISHSLSAKPDMMLVKCRQAGLWKIYHSSLGATKYLVLSDTAAVVDNNSTWNDTEPTSSNFTLGDDGNVNETGETYINYLFAEKKSFSKIGSYIGTGSDVFIHTGFKVGWLLVKNADNTNGWLVIDTKRSPANPQGKYIYANAGGAEGTVTYGEFFSNGFGWKGTGSVAVNQSGEKFIYYAIAENPFVTSTGVPATAR
jgi:hypothetical protein